MNEIWPESRVELGEEENKMLETVDFTFQGQCVY